MTKAEALRQASRYPVDRRFKVVLVDPGLLTSPYDASLSTGLNANNVDPVWITRRLRRYEEDELSPSSRPIFYPLTDGPRRRRGKIWQAVKGLEHFFGLQKLNHYVIANQPDLVHFQWSMVPFLDVAAIKRIRKVCPVVLTVHDISPFNGKAVNPLQRSGLSEVWHNMDSLIVHTEAGRQALITTGIEAQRIAVVPHGLLGKPPVTSERTRRKGAWRIVQFGRIQAYKGVDLLVEALGRMDETVRGQISAIVAGEPQIDMAPIQQRALTLGLEPNTLEFRLWRHSRLEMDALFEDADTFIFPYRTIEASGVFYEVASLRRWILASRLGTFAELLGSPAGAEMGMLVPPGDPVALAQALEDSIGRIPADDLSKIVPSWTDIGARTCAVYASATELWQRDRL